jgi:cytochrome c oxidase subunit 1
VRPRGLVDWLTRTDHKRIGVLYLFTSLAFFVSAGIMALIKRAELASPGLDVVDEATYNQLFTMQGTAMMFFFIVPFAFGLANYLVPLHVAPRTWPSPG